MKNIIVALLIAIFISGCTEKVSINIQARNETILSSAKTGDVLICTNENSDYSVFVLRQDTSRGIYGSWIQKGTAVHEDNLLFERFTNFCKKLRIANHIEGDGIIGSMFRFGKI